MSAPSSKHSSTGEVESIADSRCLNHSSYPSVRADLEVAQVHDCRIEAEPPTSQAARALASGEVVVVTSAVLKVRR
jgi:hypothetical protein